MNIGIIGCGRIAQLRHLPFLSRAKNVCIAALADIDRERLSRVADRFGINRCYNDHIALLDDQEIDAVLVCTPPAEHFAHASAVLKSGRHMFVDAPLALSVEDCNSLVELGLRTNCVATVGMNLRHHRLIQRAKHCIKDGWIGPVQAISATFTTPSRANRADKFPAWRQPQNIDGSVFMEGAIHHFDAWRDLTNAEFTSISVQSPIAGGTVSMSATMNAAERANNQRAIVVGAVFSEYAGDNSEVRVMGRDGTITLSLYRYNGFDYCPALASHGSAKQHMHKVIESIRSLPAGFRTLGAGEYGRTFELQLEAFLHAIRSNGDAIISLEDGAAATSAALAAIRSIDIQKRVELFSIV